MQTRERIYERWNLLKKVDSTIIYPELAAEAEITIEQLIDRLMAIFRVANVVGSTDYEEIRAFIENSLEQVCKQRKIIPNIVGSTPVEHYPPLVYQVDSYCKEVEVTLEELEAFFQIPPQPWMLRPSSMRK